MTEPLFAFKVLTRAQWSVFRETGVFAGAPVDIADGYIHLSARDQVAETVAKYFARTTSDVLTGAVSSPSIVPIFRSSAKSRIVMSGKRMKYPIQNQPELNRL